MRICTLLPSATEIAFALGLGDEVVGVTHECDYPPGGAKAPRRRAQRDRAGAPHSAEIDRLVGERLGPSQSLYTLDLQSFRAAEPEVVITQDLCEVCALDLNEVTRAAENLPRRPKIVSLAPATLGDVFKDITTVGEAAGRKAAAAALVSDLRLRIERVRESVARSDQRPRVACIEWSDPIYPAGHWVPEMVDLAAAATAWEIKARPQSASRGSECARMRRKLLFSCLAVSASSAPLRKRRRSAASQAGAIFPPFEASVFMP
jgi:iron complex transport system substrate-binding protein